ncbi:MAG: PIN domain-containing protein [Planctomycetes bacterium]|nr:PIN domain-containing protein [Planctomycetota bacterium]
MDRLFVDTSAWYAHVNRRDPAHAAVRDLLSGFSGRLVTSNYVFDETVTLCVIRMGHKVASRVGEALLDVSVADLVRIEPPDERAAWEHFRRRAEARYSFTDCTSFVLMRRLGLTRAAALDDDFRREGFEIVPL